MVRLSLLDLIALMVGYGTAALLIRAFGVGLDFDGPLPVAFVILLYLWLGLAMSGPILLLGRRGQPVEPIPDHEPPRDPLVDDGDRVDDASPRPGDRAEPKASDLGAASSTPERRTGRRTQRDRAPHSINDRERFTWAEMTWLAIGTYWLGLTFLVSPIRLPRTPWLGLIPILAVPLLIRLGRSRTDAIRSWTHSVGIVLIGSWPLAWIALILLFRS